MMIKNIPGLCSTEDVLKDIHDKGFGSTYDFFHLPRHRNPARNRGYGFINFASAETAADFELQMSGHCFSHSYMLYTQNTR